MSRVTRAGFTLIELLVVFSIMGMLLVFLPSAFLRIMPGIELKAGAREVAGILREARLLAIRSNRDVAVIVDTEARTLRVGDKAQMSRLSNNIAVALGTDESEQVSDSSGMIRFYPDGSSTGGRIKLVGEEQAYHVVVDWLTGRVAIKEQPF